MTTKEYIESGNLEAYVLGVLSPQEEAQVQADIARDPELAAEVARLEDTLFNAAMADAMPPPPALDDKIWGAIQASTPAQATGTAELPPAQPAPQQVVPKTIPLPPPAPRTSAFRYAAMWGALVISVAMNGMFWMQSSKQKELVAARTAEIDSMKRNQEGLAQLLNNYHKRADMMADTSMKTIVMQTMVKDHPMAATMYWNKSNGHAYVMLDALPKPPEGMQYQLWVIQDGKPVSMGVLSSDMIATAAIEKVDMQVTDAQAFAISLEKQGGNPTPTTVYVMGKS